MLKPPKIKPSMEQKLLEAGKDSTTSSSNKKMPKIAVRSILRFLLSAAGSDKL